MRPFPRFLAAALAAGWAATPCPALQVYLNTNSPGNSAAASQLFEKDGWHQAAAAVDGIWYVGQGMSKAPGGGDVAKARAKWIESLKDKRWIVEMKQESAAAMAGKKHLVHEVKAMKQAGISPFAAMVWSEKHNKDSTIAAKEVAAVREGLQAAGAADTAVIVNTRAFQRNRLLQELVDKDLVDGFSIEIPSHPVRQGQILEQEVAAAIEFAVRKKKDVYVLINAERSSQFLKDIQDIYERLRRSASRAMRSPHTRIVLSSYSAGKTRFTPDSRGDDCADTVTGAALWLCREADKHRLREERE